MTNSKNAASYPKMRGVDLLFNSADFSESKIERNEVDLESICLAKNQSRRYFDPQKLEELTESIRHNGVLEPILVRPRQEGMYELVAGERRYRAARAAGLDRIPIVTRELNDEEAWEIALVENLLREDLNPVEETEAILQLLASKLDLEITEIASFLYRMRNEAQGKSTHNVMGSENAVIIREAFQKLGGMSWESFVANRLPLLNLPEDILEALQQGRIAYTKALAISRLKDSGARIKLLEQSIADQLSLNQIRKQVSEIGKQKEALEKPQEFKVRLREAAKLCKASSIWNNKNKSNKAERLLSQLEELLNAP